MAATNVAQEMGAGLLEEKIGHTLPIAATISTGDPLPVENISMGNIENGFDSFIMPGVLVLILHQCIVLASGMAGARGANVPAVAAAKRRGRWPYPWPERCSAI